MTKASELRSLEPADIETRLNEAQKELFNLRFQLATGRLDSFTRIPQVRKEIARILTLQGEAAVGFVPPARVTKKVRTNRPNAPSIKKAAAPKVEDSADDDSVEEVEAE